MANVDVTKESSGNMITHGHTVVGTGAVQIATTSPPKVLDKGVILRAPAANTVDVYIGVATLTADTAAATGGFPLAPGDALFVPIDDHTKIWARASAASQDLAWLTI
jgi:hypothetical protein